MIDPAVATGMGLGVIWATVSSFSKMNAALKPPGKAGT